MNSNFNLWYCAFIALLILVPNMIISQSDYMLESEKPLKNIDTDVNRDILIEGRLVDSADEPVIGATITVEGTVIESYTDKNGYFRIVGMSSGVYLLQVEAFGFKRMEHPLEVTINGTSFLELKFDKPSVEIPEVLLLAKSDRQLSKVPGSGSFINQKEIRNLSPISGNEIFRRITGIHAVDEEGLGMRVNIGIRGLDPDRSRSVLILEDGIPVALAPYGEPEMYYTPAMDRMSGIEVLKGSGQILFGPQTIGGVINYLSVNPPSESLGTARFMVGQGGYFNTVLGYGNTVNDIGYQINFLKKRADQVGLTGFDITDLTGKVVLNTSDRSVLSVKGAIYNERSNSTYIGLTQTMFDSGGQDFVHMAPDDELMVRRISGSVSHDYEFSKKVNIKTTAFAFTTTRDWRRQDFTSNGTQNNPPSNWTGVTWGDETVAIGAVYMRNSTGNRNRSFFVSGVESRLQVQHNLFNKSNHLKTGIRFLHEVALEQRINGTKFNVKSGNLVSDETRTGEAWSAYVQNTTDISSGFSLHYGARFENFNYTRDISRGNYSVNGANQIVDTSIVSSSGITQFIPGAGFTWQIHRQFNLFGGVHRGFAPPRTKDAISNSGDVYELDAENSTNFELGMRSGLGEHIRLELTGFYMNFSNQIIPVAESSGGTGAGLVNGGKTIHRGIETVFQLNISSLTGLTKTGIYYDLNFTLVDAFYGEGRQIGEESLAGKKTPYAPSVLFNSSLQLETVSGMSFQLTANYVGSQFADELNTVTAHPNGRSGQIPSWYSIDGTAGYRVNKWNTTFRVSVKNLTNERFITSRRPQGIKVGLPRYISGGIEVSF